MKDGKSVAVWLWLRFFLLFLFLSSFLMHFSTSLSLSDEFGPNVLFLVSEADVDQSGHRSPRLLRGRG